MMHRFFVLLLLWAPLATAAQVDLHVVMLLEKPALGGTLRVALCPSRQAYNADSGCLQRSLPVEGPSAVCDFSDLSPGSYAVKVFQDVNGDGLLNSNWLGWPKEPVGYSNDAPINQGEPPFLLAAMQLAPGPHTDRIRVR